MSFRQIEFCRWLALLTNLLAGAFNLYQHNFSNIVANIIVGIAVFIYTGRCIRDARIRNAIRKLKGEDCGDF